MTRKISLDIITALLILLFSYAAISKLLAYPVFKFQLSKSPFTTHYAVLIAWALPLIELFAVALLIVKKTRFLGLYLSFFLLMLFTCYIYALLHFSNYVPCSCGGVIAHLSWDQHLVFNLIFTAIALIGVLMDVSQTKMETQIISSDKDFREKRERS